MKITIQHEKLKTPIIALIFKEIGEEAAIEEFVNHWYKKSLLFRNYFV